MPPASRAGRGPVARSARGKRLLWSASARMGRSCSYRRRGARTVCVQCAGSFIDLAMRRWSRSTKVSITLADTWGRQDSVPLHHVLDLCFVERMDGTLGSRNAAPPALAGVAATWLEDGVAGVCGLCCARSSGIPPGSRVIAFATVSLTSCGRCRPAFAQQVGELVRLILRCLDRSEGRAHRLEILGRIVIRFTWVQAPSSASRMMFIEKALCASRSASVVWLS